MRKFFLFLTIFLLLPVTALARIPNDPGAEQWAYKDIGLYQAWDLNTGSEDVVVAVIDNGFDMFHPDLIDNLWINKKEIPYNGIDDDHNGYVDDVYGWNFVPADYNHDGIIDAEEALGNNDPRPEFDYLTPEQKKEGVFNHGTLVAGLIGAVGNNNEAIAGVNWKVELMNLKVLDDSGSGANLKPLAKAIRYAVDNGAKIINISAVGDADPEVKLAVKYAFDQGIVVVAAAGNSMMDLNVSPLYPVCADAGESEPWVLGVSAVDVSHHLAVFSDVGSDCIDLTAPGVEITSTLRFSPTDGFPLKYGGGYKGTSFATPLVSGVAALIKGIHEEWGPKEIYQAILSTVHHTPSQDEADYANIFGAGLLQADKAVEYAIAKLEATRPLNNLSVLDFKTGNFFTKDLNSLSQNSDNKIFLKQALAAKVFQDQNGEKFWVVEKRKNKQTVEISIYDSGDKKINSWPVTAKGRLNILSGKIWGNSEEQIILAPDYADKNVYQVFSLQGKELLKYNISQKHEGVSLALSYNAFSKQNELLALYKDQGKLKMHQFKSAEELSNSFAVNVLGRGEISAGDVNGDGNSEYVIAGSLNDGPTVVIYNKAGEILRNFLAYDSAVKGLLSISVGNYNQDNKDEIITVYPGESVVVWSDEVKKLEEWQPAGAGSEVGWKVFL